MKVRTSIVKCYQMFSLLLAHPVGKILKDHLLLLWEPTCPGRTTCDHRVRTNTHPPRDVPPLWDLHLLNLLSWHHRDSPWRLAPRNSAIVDITILEISTVLHLIVLMAFGNSFTVKIVWMSAWSFMVSQMNKYLTLAPVKAFPSLMNVFPDIWLWKKGVELPSSSIWRNTIYWVTKKWTCHSKESTSTFFFVKSNNIFSIIRTSNNTKVEPQMTSRQGSCISSFPSSAAYDGASIVIIFIACLWRNSGSMAPFSRAFLETSSSKSLFFVMYVMYIRTVFRALSTPLIDGDEAFNCGVDKWSMNPVVSACISDAILVLKSNIDA